MIRWRENFQEIRRYPSAVVGLVIIFALVGISAYTVLALPYGEAMNNWRGGEQWRMYPLNAGPVWLDRLFGGNKPESTIADSSNAKISQTLFEGGRQIHMPLTFVYDYDDFPSEINLFVTVRESERESFLRLTWINPAGEELLLGGYRVAGTDRISISQDRGLEARLGTVPHIGLLTQPGTGSQEVQHGRYQLVLDAIMYGEEPELEADLVLYGRVYGIAGTDHQRRDLMVALLWGTPVALLFGLLAAMGTTVTTLIIAAVGVWFGGWVDAVIQRLTEINMILPLLPILVMIGTLYSTSIWLMLGVVILLGIFSGGIKMYRAMLLPVREAPYIEAARAYGAGNTRIILHYMLPRILPVLIPTFVTLIPTFVFLEASLAVLGLGDPILPTWGKILNDAQVNSALYSGYYYWVLLPAFLLMITGLGFALLGFALDRVFNPRLRRL